VEGRESGRAYPKPAINFTDDNLQRRHVQKWDDGVSSHDRFRAFLEGKWGQDRGAAGQVAIGLRRDWLIW